MNEDTDDLKQCQSCTLTFRGELMVDDNVWELIKPAGAKMGEGILCPICICNRVHDMGITRTLLSSIKEQVTNPHWHQQEAWKAQIRNPDPDLSIYEEACREAGALAHPGVLKEDPAGVIGRLGKALMNLATEHSVKFSDAVFSAIHGREK